MKSIRRASPWIGRPPHASFVTAPPVPRAAMVAIGDAQKYRGSAQILKSPSAPSKVARTLILFGQRSRSCGSAVLWRAPQALAVTGDTFSGGWKRTPYDVFPEKVVVKPSAKYTEARETQKAAEARQRELQAQIERASEKLARLEAAGQSLELKRIEQRLSAAALQMDAIARLRAIQEREAQIVRELMMRQEQERQIVQRMAEQMEMMLQAEEMELAAILLLN